MSRSRTRTVVTVASALTVATVLLLAEATSSVFVGPDDDFAGFALFTIIGVGAVVAGLDVLIFFCGPALLAGFGLPIRDRRARADRTGHVWSTRLDGKTEQ